ncbi:hypothetical protein ACFFKU_04560 [Kineococcus gynurae]|uniref:Uncharacterized protein n=1 Tax=Kineococcus gynurae TaxID=452979 RepID=A0ABV5LRB8_9ACTN
MAVASNPSAAVPAPRRTRRSRTAPVEMPLGSLTQAEHRGERSTCTGCGSERITQLLMSLTDGTPVTFVSCHVCELRTWESAAGPITVDAVLERSRKK